MAGKLIGNIHWALIAYAAFGVYVGYQEHAERVESLKGSEEAVQTKIRRQKRDLSEIESYQKEIKENQAKIETVVKAVEAAQKRLPTMRPGEDDSGVFEELARDINMRDVQVATMVQENKGFYFVNRYGVKATGTFLQFLLLLEKLTEEDRLFNIPTLSLEMGNVPQRGRFALVGGDIAVESYRYNADHQEDRGVPGTAAAAAQAPDPGAAP